MVSTYIVVFYQLFPFSFFQGLEDMKSINRKGTQHSPVSLLHFLIKVIWRLIVLVVVQMFVLVAGGQLGAEGCSQAKQEASEEEVT